MAAASVKDSHVQDLLSTLRGNDVDRKISEFTAIKALVKHHVVQSDAINDLFQACEIGIQSSNNSLSANALSCLGHLIKRVSLQEPARIRPHCHNILPILVEKIGDPKDRNRTVAMNSILEIFKHCPLEVEKHMKEIGFVNKNPRTKLESINWLTSVHAAYSIFAFRSYTPLLMEMLEDASEAVRETAKNAVVTLFKNAQDHAKSDLKKELQKRQVRKGISTYILSQLGVPSGGGGGGGGGGMEIKSSLIGEDGHEEETTKLRQTNRNPADDINGSTKSPSQVTSLPGTEMEHLDPVYVNTGRELDDIFHSMVESFDGRESEHNWLNRERNITKLRQLARGNAYKDFQSNFQVGIKSLLDGILKTVNSLRTTVATNGGQLIKDLAIIMGPGLDPQVEILLMNFVKLCAGTKKITSQLGQVVVVVILANVSYHPKVLQHIWGACGDKNVSPRSYAPVWILVILETHADHKSHIEHSGGVEILEKCLRRGLADANPGVRESMRRTYWRFQVDWPDRAEKILESLDGSHRKLLEKANPNGQTQKTTTDSRPSAAGRGHPAVARPSIKEAILAQKRSKSAKILPESSQAPPPAVVTSGLSSAPVRRPVKQKGQERNEKALDIQSIDPEVGLRTSPGKTNGSHTPPLAAPRLTILEQLNHIDWKTRVEGIVTVACILAKRTPPNYEGQQLPALPPHDVFAPALARLLNDSQAEVIEHLVAPEVLVELTKVVPMEHIVPKVLLLSQADDEQHARVINTTSMPTLKKLLQDTEAAELLLKIVTALSASGVTSRKAVSGSFSISQKRKIINGCLLWLNEIIESHLAGAKNEFFSDYKLIVNRLVSIFPSSKPQTQSMIGEILKNLEIMNPDTFKKILSTFESNLLHEIRKTWGTTMGDDVDYMMIEEKAASVEQVLGLMPQIREAQSKDDGDLTSIRVQPVAGPGSPREHLSAERDTFQNTEQSGSTSQPSEAPFHPLSGNIQQTGRSEIPPAEISVNQDRKMKSEDQGGSVEYTTNISTPLNHQSQSNQSNPSTDRSEESKILAATIRRLQSRDMDTQAFRKLIGIAKENPVQEGIPGQNRGEFDDLWRGGKVFEELLCSLLDYLMADDIGTDRTNDLRIQGLLVLKQLLVKTAPYFGNHEAQVLSTLISVRGRYPSQSHITSGIEEISEEYMRIAQPQTAINAILDLCIPLANPKLKQATPSWCMSLSCLAALVRESSLESLEPQLPRLGQLAVKSLDDEDSEVRRSCVAMCIEMHSKLNDDEKLFDDILRGMKSGHQNLLAYYFAKREGEAR